MKFALNDKAKRFSRFSGNKFLDFILFSRNWILYSALVDLEKIQP